MSEIDELFDVVENRIEHDEDCARYPDLVDACNCGCDEALEALTTIRSEWEEMEERARLAEAAARGCGKATTTLRTRIQELGEELADATDNLAVSDMADQLVEAEARIQELERRLVSWWRMRTYGAFAPTTFRRLRQALDHTDPGETV